MRWLRILLKTLCPFIDFKKMNGKYFADNVIPKKCLSNEQIIEISSAMLYRHDKEKKDLRASIRSLQRKNMSLFQENGSLQKDLKKAKRKSSKK